MLNPNVLVRIICGALVFLFCGFGSLAYASDAVVGKWQAYDRLSGTWKCTLQISKNSKNSTYYARIVKVNPKYKKHITRCTKCPGRFQNKPVRGFIMAWNLKPSKKNPRLFVDGYSINPWSGEYFKVRGQLKDDMFRVKASLANKPTVKQAFVWKRVD